MPRGSYLFCFAKKGDPKKASPTIGLFPKIAGETAERKKLAALKQFSVLIAFSPAIFGANQRGPENSGECDAHRGSPDACIRVFVGLIA